jgi:hypothetical protein
MIMALCCLDFIYDVKAVANEISEIFGEMLCVSAVKSEKLTALVQWPLWVRRNVVLPETFSSVNQLLTQLLGVAAIFVVEFDGIVRKLGDRFQA